MHAPSVAAQGAAITLSAYSEKELAEVLAEIEAKENRIEQQEQEYELRLNDIETNLSYIEKTIQSIEKQNDNDKSFTLKMLG